MWSSSDLEASQARANIVILHCRGRYTKIDFQVVMEAAKTELINFVRKEAT